MTNDKILDKIKKCLKLSTSSNEHEAAAALRQAQKLMAAHGISQLDLGLADIGQEEVNSKYSVSTIKPFEGRLINMICKAFGCSIVFKGAGGRQYAKFLIVGIKSQVEIAQYTCEVMSRKLFSARSSFNKSLPTYLSRNEKTIQCDGFSMGWVEGVTSVINEFANSEETKLLIDKYIEVNFGRLKSKKHENRRLGQAGFEAGKQQGARESIYRPMNGKEQLKIGA